MEELLNNRTSKNSSRVSSIILDENNITRRVLLPEIVNNPNNNDEYVKVTIAHQRKSSKTSWVNVESIKLNSLKSGEGVKLELNCEQTKKLYDSLKQLYALGKDGVPDTGEYVVCDTNDVVIVNGKEKEYINKLIQLGHEDYIWNELINNSPTLATSFSYARIHEERVKAVHEFECNLKKNRDEQFWQKFFNENDWIFNLGLCHNIISVIEDQAYLGGKCLNNNGGKICDYLAASGADAKYAVIIEIKKDYTALLSSEDRNGSYPISKDLSMALSQIQGYCNECATNVNTVNELKGKDIFAVNPKGIIVIGNTNELDNDNKKISFELFRKGLNNIDIITYDELLKRAKYIVKKI